MRCDNPKRLAVVGGAYFELCMAPEWNQLLGSGLRAALALKRATDVAVTLHTRCRPEDESRIQGTIGTRSSLENCVPRDFDVVFDYVHPLSVPQITPRVDAINKAPLAVRTDIAIVFGMLDADLDITAKRIVYDPQSPANPTPFCRIGKANEVVLILNATEAFRMTGETSEDSMIKTLRDLNGASTIIIKRGILGADVYTDGEKRSIPAYRSRRSFPIGSGDMFTTTFGYFWLCHGLSPFDAADRASRIVGKYSDRFGLAALDLNKPVELPRYQYIPGIVYLAAPFFTLSELWLVNEVKRELESVNLEVKSPLHAVGRGDANTVAEPDLALLAECDRVFAILDNFDPGTNYELGWAKAHGIPIVAFYSPAASAQNFHDSTTMVGDRDDRLKMVFGNGACLYDDLASAISAVGSVSKKRHE